MTPTVITTRRSLGTRAASLLGLVFTECIPTLDGRKMKEISNHNPCRRVFKLGDIIVKVDCNATPKSAKCDRQTAREIAFLPFVEAEDRKHFANVIAHGETFWNGHWKAWIAVERIPFKRGRANKTEVAEMKVIREKYFLYDIGSGSYTGNYGVHRDGYIVVYDWGLYEDIKLVARRRVA